MATSSAMGSAKKLGESDRSQRLMVNKSIRAFPAATA
jgi:hypothetical protein